MPPWATARATAVLTSPVVWSAGRRRTRRWSAVLRRREQIDRHVVGQQRDAIGARPLREGLLDRPARAVACVRRRVAACDWLEVASASRSKAPSSSAGGGCARALRAASTMSGWHRPSPCAACRPGARQAIRGVQHARDASCAKAVLASAGALRRDDDAAVLGGAYRGTAREARADDDPSQQDDPIYETGIVCGTRWRRPCITIRSSVRTGPSSDCLRGVAVVRSPTPGRSGRAGGPTASSSSRTRPAQRALEGLAQAGPGKAAALRQYRHHCGSRVARTSALTSIPINRPCTASPGAGSRRHQTESDYSRRSSPAWARRGSYSSCPFGPPHGRDRRVRSAPNIMGGCGTSGPRGTSAEPPRARASSARPTRR